MSRAWKLLSERGLDLLVVVAAVAAALVTALRADEGRPSGAWPAVEALASGGIVLALLGRRRFPFVAPAAVWLVSPALSFLDGRLIVDNDVVFVTGMGAALLLGNLPNLTQARVGLALVVGGAAIVVHNAPGRGPAELVFTPVLFALGWLVGFALRGRDVQAQAAEERAARAEREREAAARVAVAEERGRIARELHDVVAHAVSVMVLQVGAVRHRMEQGATEDVETLRNVEHVGRSALAEMRRLLGAMRSEDEGLELVPHPGLDDLDALVDDVCAAGLPVRLRTLGDPVPLPPALDLSAYRIVQEGLTNSLKHARASLAEVEVRYDRDQLRLRVRDDGRTAATGDPGHGLVGIRERVKIYGGDMSARRTREGGFVLEVSLPLSAVP